jgi:hypothetical protein
MLRVRRSEGNEHDGTRRNTTSECERPNVEVTGHLKIERASKSSEKCDTGVSPGGASYVMLCHAMLHYVMSIGKFS